MTNIKIVVVTCALKFKKMEQLTKKEYLDLVDAELKAIKQHATPEELSWLNIYSFQPRNTGNCIYGQLTGNCRSKRAIELINLCCKVYVSNAGISKKSYSGNNWNFSNNPINTNDSYIRYVSALEAYIFTSDHATNITILKYLRGDIDAYSLT